MTKLKFLLYIVIILTANIAIGQDDIQQTINHYISQAKLDSARAYIRTTINKTKQKEEKAVLSYQLVKVLFMQSAYDDALQEAFNSLDAIDDNELKVKFDFMIGVIYSAISDYDKSIEYFDLVVKQNEEPSLSIQTHLLLSDLYLGKKDSVKAGNSITEAFKISSRFNLDPKTERHVAMQYNFFNKNYEQCKQLNFKTINDSTSFLNSKSYAYSMIGECLIKQDSLKESTKYLQEFLKLTFETKDPEQIKVASSKLIEVYEKLGNQETANAYHKIYNEAEKDSLSFSIEKYRDLYDIEKARELNSVKAKSRRNYLIFGLILLIIILSGAYYLSKSKQKYKEAFSTLVKTPGKKIVISDGEIEKIKTAIDELEAKELFLKPNITRKSFCNDNQITSERYLSQYINENYKKSFSVFINDLRIEYAHNRIQNDNKFRNYKIEEIAKEAGFGSKKSFERAFLAKYNETPYKLISRLIS